MASGYFIQFTWLMSYLSETQVVLKEASGHS